VGKAERKVAVKKNFHRELLVAKTYLPARESFTKRAAFLSCIADFNSESRKLKRVLF
jgi:hypothetical protein